MYRKNRRWLTAVLALGCVTPLALQAQDAAPAPAAAAKTPEASAEDAETITLSPFQVNTSKDSGYKATNSISGTRLDSAIKDIPMPIEVITEQFIRDTGANDLRQTLRYSAGILLQTQNDQGNSAYRGPGGVNNPEGVTADPSNTYVKMRGFVTSVMLRDGFRRQNSTDSVNVGRVEVVRGPAALLYGIGNFGGVVNYMPKMPNAKGGGEYTVSAGTYNFLRATFDQTGAISKDGKLAYRVTAAGQNAGSHTDFFNEKHWFLSPVIQYKPFDKTDIVIDFEIGRQKIKGMGFQQVRSVAGVGVNNDQNEHGGLFTVPGTNPRTFRMSGPDTYQHQQASNLEIKLSQEIFKGLNLLTGFNHSTFNYQQRDVYGNLTQNVGPKSLQRTVVLFPVDPNTPSSNQSVVTGPVENVVLQYNWSNQWFENTRDQFRVELNYKLDLFTKSNKWLRNDHSVLGGYSVEKNQLATWDHANAENTFNYIAPTDTNAIHWGLNGDGSVDKPLSMHVRNESTAVDKGIYAVYTGRFLDKRLLVLAGARKDTNDLKSSYSNAFHPDWASSTSRPQAKDVTHQSGASFAITREISLYGLQSGGLEPNFGGAKDGYGTPMGAVTAKSKEVGVKIDLFNGKVSATFSKFKITKEGTPISYWWAPSAIGGKTKFDPTKDIIYNVNNFTPTPTATVAVGGSNGGNGSTDAALSQWNAGVAAGAIYQKTIGDATSWYVNASKTTGAAYLDAVFADTIAKGMSWPGWLYNSDSHTNNAWGDIAASNGASQSGTSESKGWDCQILFSPSENLQFVLNYAHTNIVIQNPGNFIKYPYPQDRWAVWYFPNTDWGLTGQPIKTMYTDPTDTSTWTGYGYGAGTKADDTPKHHFDWFGIYRFKDGSLKGLSVGLGGSWESEREYLSGITHGAGQKITDKNGNPIVRATPSRLNLDFMIGYAWKTNNHPQNVQLNINNLLNDTKTYGLIYAAPLTARLEYSYKW